MDNAMDLETRVARLEERIDELARRLDGRPAATSARDGAAPERGPESVRSAAHVREPSFQAKSAEWWLARGGALLTSVALFLLYDYAVDRNWITPVIRVVIGTLVGTALMLAGRRVARKPDDLVGLREVLFGAGLAAWYITAYAAGVWYALIPLGLSRAAFLGISIAGAWLALTERRSILAILALAVGFSVPVILPSASPSAIAFSIYIAALGGLGLVLYLMRGWQTVLWLSFGAFWWNVGQAADLAAVRIGWDTAIALTLLLVAGAAAFVRTPILRRRLLATGAERYTEPQRSEWSRQVMSEFAAFVTRLTGRTAAADSMALWVITVSSPLLALAFLPGLWPAVSSLAWSVAALAIGALAWRQAASAKAADDEFTHVEAFAAVMWTLVGVVWLASPVSDLTGLSATAGRVAFASLYASLLLNHSATAGYPVVGRVGRATLATATVFVILREYFLSSSAFQPAWTIAALVAALGSAHVWWTSRTENDGKRRIVFGLLAYAALMIIDARVLGNIWSPLVTMSYAVAGATLLIMSVSAVQGTTLRKLGGVTLVIVVLRLLMVDLAGVETIWRVLLFLVCGGLFLFTSHRMQSWSRRSNASATTQ